MAAKLRAGLVLLAFVGTAPVLAPAQPEGPHIPVTSATLLNGQTLSLPKDLQTPATVFIVGFGRHSQDATTAWERPVRTQLARNGAIDFYDAAMLAEVPGFVRPMVLGMIKRKVPDVLKPNFLALTEAEDTWKRIAGYASDQPEAAYVFVVDHDGRVRWSTHRPFSPAALADLRQHAEEVAAKPS